MRNTAVLILFLNTLFLKAQSESPWVPGIVLIKISGQSNIELPAAYYCKAEINGEITLIRLIVNR